jgi:hypothetical protein
MKHFASPEFWAAYERVPRVVQTQADRHFDLLKNDPQHPSLKLKKVGRFWSVRIGLRYRALAVELDGDLQWFWIGSHAAYDQIIR